MWGGSVRPLLASLLDDEVECRVIFLGNSIHQEERGLLQDVHNKTHLAIELRNHPLMVFVAHIERYRLSSSDQHEFRAQSFETSLSLQNCISFGAEMHRSVEV
jgi:hypothetical protein